MTRRLSSPSLAVAAAIFVVPLSGAPALAQPAEPDARGGSAFTIEAAIDAAKRCVLERKIHLVGSFIEAARFERNPRGDRGPYWTVTWARAREVKGGQVFVAVSQDRSCEITYGE